MGDVWEALPGPDATDEEVAAWVHEALIAIDARPRHRMWRWRAVGGNLADALADAGLRDARLDIRVPVSEMRVITAVCRAREIGPRAYLRRAFGTMLVVCDGLEPSDVPGMCAGGLIGPPGWMR